MSFDPLPCGHKARVAGRGEVWIDTSIWYHPYFAAMTAAEQLGYFAGLSVIAEHGGDDLICGSARWHAPLVEAWPDLCSTGIFTAVADGLRVEEWFGSRIVSARLAAGRAPISPELRARVYARDGYRCVHCDSRAFLSLDHIHPWSLGGSDTFDNLQTLCRSCNSRKGARV